MQELPICTECGQDEEYLISDSGQHTCICGHEFMVLDTENCDETHNFIENVDLLKRSRFFDNYSTLVH
ncbi:hypothetical protein GCM10007086_14810 [Photobacterium aphoticum]|nr:hypothetical protein GCM10007086_14810 [Photobacterium aphoticum]